VTDAKFHTPLENHRDRTTWPFNALMPFPVVLYPMPQSGKVVGPQRPSDWPPKIDDQVAAWRDRTASLGSDGNQIYVHVPFCPFICDFCHFYKVTDLADRDSQMREAYVQAILKEIAMYSSMPVARDKTYNTIYFGGGTPSQLSAAQIVRIIDALRANFNVAKSAEITLEGVAHQLLSPGYLEKCLAAGVNRISYGVQSLDADVRAKAGRGREHIEHYAKLVELAHRLDPGMDVNVDVMACLPDQDAECFLRDIRGVIDWGVTGVDVYYYVMMPGTPLYRSILSGERSCHEYGAAMLEMRDMARRTFLQAGFHQLTGESFVRTKGDDRFMQTFTKGGGNALNAVLPLGPSAQGDFEATNYRNVADLKEYLKIVDSGRLPINNATQLQLDVAQRRAVLYSLLRLRVPDMLVETREQRKYIKRWHDKGLMVRDGSDHVFTDRGALWYNQMQIEYLAISDFKSMAQMIGSFAEVEQMMDDPKNGLGREIREMIRGDGGVVGDLKYLGFKSAMKVAKSLPILDQRAVGWTGRVT
jgi:coproporphyrinogen III oxidase-like Fe-S oxidoreductase